MNSSISTLCSLEIHFSSFYFAYVQPNHFCFTMKNVSFTFISRLKKRFMVISISKIKGFNLKHNICRCICSLTQIFGIDSMHLNISRTFICSPILFFVVALIVIRYMYLEKILGVNSTFGWVWRDNQSNVPYLILRKTLVLIKWENVDLDWVKKRWFWLSNKTLISIK